MGLILGIVDGNFIGIPTDDTARIIFTIKDVKASINLCLLCQYLSFKSEPA